MLIPRAAWIFSIGLAILGAGTVSGQDYPTKPIRIVTGPAGGGTDFTARLVAQGVTSALGQPTVMDNRSGVTQGEVVSKSPPDGYTLLIAGGNLWIAPLLQKVPYDVVRDFTPVSLIEKQALVLVVHPSVPTKSLQQLISLAKTRPGELNFSTGVAGGSSQLAMELFNSMAGIKTTRVAYKGSGQALVGLLSGEAQILITDVGLAAPQMKSGKLRALAVTSAQPSALAPGLPTMSASGVPGYELIGMTGMFAPAKTPLAIVTRVSQEIGRYVNRAEIKERFINGGVEPVGSSPEEFAVAIKADIEKLGKVIKDAGLKSD